VEVVVDSIETAGPDRRARRLVFRDGIEPRLTSASVVKELGLEPDCRLDLAEFESALAAVERRAAKERALRILAARERSSHEVTQRLLDDGYPDVLSRETVARMVELGVIDDDRFAGMWARSRFAAGFGSRRVLNELARRGIDAAAAQSAVAEAAGESDELKRAIAALGGRSAGNRKERERLIRRLVSRGFDLRVAIAALDATAPSADL